MFFSDLTPYSYISSLQSGNDLNVGWLSCEHAFPVGETSAELRRGLSELATEPVNGCMGSHDCEFCTPPMKEFLFWRWQPPRLDSIASGNGEIRVPALQGDIVYVAPQLVAHYVEAHNYLPPPEFIEAAMVFAHGRRMAWEALRAQWRERIPALDGRWTHWRLFSYDCLVSVVSRDELARLIERVEHFYRASFSVGVSRSYIDPGGQGVVVESMRHAISEVDVEYPKALVDSFVSHMRDPSAS